MRVTEIVAIAGVAAVVAYVLSWIQTYLRHSANAKRLGCKPAPRLGMDPTGIEGAVRGAKAQYSKDFPPWVQARFDELAPKCNGRIPGTIAIKAPLFTTVYMTTDPQNIQAILATKFKEFEFGPNRTENFEPLLGHGIFAANGKQWEHSRALLRPQFVRGQISDLDLEEDHVQNLMKTLETHIGEKQWTNLVDLQPLFFHLTLDSATEFLFGESVDSQINELKGGASRAKEFANAFDQSQMTLAVGSRLGNKYWWLVHTKAFHQNVKTVHDFVDYFVQRAMSSNKTEKKSGGDDKYVFLNALAEQTQDPVELRSQLLNILLAGRDTTASSLGWFFYLMSQPKYTKFYNKLRTIVLENFGTYSNPHDITFETMKNCQYLQWCMNETLRLYPVVSFNVRTASMDTCLPVGGGPDGKDPVYVKKGQDVGYGVHLMHRRKDLWGDDAEEFRPDRWENRRPGWDYLPFNGGPRICIGQQFALTEMAYVLIRMIQRIEEIDGSQVGEEKHGLTLTNCPGNGVKVRLRFADE